MRDADLLGAPVLRKSAWFADPGARISLSRDWATGPRALVIGCNPSTADADKDDPTSRWWNAWFKLFGFAGYDAMNLYPFCTSSPAECRERVARVDAGLDYGDRDLLHFNNLPHLVEAAKKAAQVFVCWGAIAWDDAWVEHVVEEIQTGVEPYPDLWCWGTTASGAPKHPLARGKHRIAPDQKPILWRAA
jgi:hypothetical protein